MAYIELKLEGVIMRIKLDSKHYLVSDPYCYWIVTEVKTKNNTVYDRVVSGYYAHLDAAIANYIDKKIRSSEAESIKELAKDLDELKRTVHEWKLVIKNETRTR